MESTANATSFLIFVGLVVLAAVAFTLTQAQWIWRLRKYGTHINATIIRNARYHEQWYRRGLPGGKDVQYITAEWTDPQTQKTYTFRKRMARGPVRSAGDSMPILVDPKNPRRYHA